MTGLAVCAAVLAAASAFGVLRGRRDGRIREVRVRRGSGPDRTESEAAGHRRTGRADGAAEASEAAGADRLTAADLGAALGERATLVQFSTAFCQPCRATRRTLADVAGMVPGVAHVEIDAEAHLDLVRALGIWRTPTVLVLDASGRIVRRASGQPRRADVIAALGEAV
ncbi:thioredoxin family protein [Streptomyces sp. B1866]|uniref:TlpA family protein disulfide reductase n=1 Tax=Streptomyces sp. B1866 TaxID=3075431 RepID=UPI00288F5FAD|nr:thioredoxin family protein [Streptomyces sp. B1866]MDT3399019.1 thioredoxin family protein [Streptomyces sp. B1866]